MHMHAKPPHKVLIAAIILTFIFALVELAGGLWSNSLALLSDAGHMGSDALALGIAAFAAWISLKPPSDKHTFGLGRAEVIAAWLSSLLMFVISIVVIIEAIDRFHNPHAINGPIVMIIASIGMIINIYIAWLLSKSEQTLNIRAAMLHVLSDLLGSLAALVSGAVVTFTHWIEIDPILSILIAVLIMFSSVQLLKESLAVLMEGTPRHINIRSVKNSMLAIQSIESLHDLHIWTLSSGRTVLSAHVVIENMECWENTLQTLHKTLRDEYHIEHVTLQPELHMHVVDKTCAAPAKEHKHDD